MRATPPVGPECVCDVGEMDVQAFSLWALFTQLLTEGYLRGRGMNTAPPSGLCAPQFLRVYDAFAHNFAERGDIGASVAVTLGGVPVVDLWGGWADAQQTRPWQRQTIAPVWSVGKAVSALCVLRLADAGRIRSRCPGRPLLAGILPGWQGSAPRAHAAQPPGRAAGDRQAAAAGRELLSSDTMTVALAEQLPWWPPGTRFGYHVNTLGFLLGELVRRVDGRSLGTYVREELATALGVDFLIGVPAAEDGRVAHWFPYQPAPGEETQRPWLERDAATATGLDLARILAYRNPPALPDAGPNTRVWRAAEFPSTNPHSNARALARLFGGLACGGLIEGQRLLSPALIHRATAIAADGEDAILGRPNRFGLGFQLTIPGVRPLGPEGAPSGTTAMVPYWALPIPTRGWASATSATGPAAPGATRATLRWSMPCTRRWRSSVRNPGSAPRPDHGSGACSGVPRRASPGIEEPSCRSASCFPRPRLVLTLQSSRTMRQTAERLGFSHILAYDHVLGAVHEGRQPPLTGPYTEASTFHEPLVLFGYLAGLTSTIGFVTGIVIVTQRQTALVAKQAAEVAVLSGNRLRLGIGTGWNYVEYEALGVPYRDRGKREEEQVVVLRRLWTSPVVDYTGHFHRIDRAGIQPLLSRPIPIWFGGSVDAVVDRTAAPRRWLHRRGSSHHRAGARPGVGGWARPGHAGVREPGALRHRSQRHGAQPRAVATGRRHPRQH